MPRISFIFAATVIAALIPLAASAMAVLDRNARARPDGVPLHYVTLFSPRPGFANAASPLKPAAFFCSYSGQMTCINGWRWVCQCYPQGGYCMYMTTAYRC